MWALGKPGVAVVTARGLGADRRALLRRAAGAAVWAGVGAVAFAEAADVMDRRLPIRGGAAGAAPGDNPLGDGRVTVTWQVHTTDKRIALTFDDGPRPRWTSMVLDTLEAAAVPATFFLVGRRVRKYASVLRGRMHRHEVANHTWNHDDMARMDARDAYDNLARSHEAIAEVTGAQPRLLRPPWAHLGGGTMLAAARMRYQVVLWSVQMRESWFPADPDGHARYVVDQLAPGSILLAHDIGDEQRLVALRGLPAIIAGARAKGYQFVTASELIGATSRLV